MQPIFQELFDNGIVTVEAMKRLSDEEWKVYKIPKAVQKKLKVALEKMPSNRNSNAT